MGPWVYAGDIGSVLGHKFDIHSPVNFVTNAQAQKIFSVPPAAAAPVLAASSEANSFVWLGMQARHCLLLLPRDRCLFVVARHLTRRGAALFWFAVELGAEADPSYAEAPRPHVLLRFALQRERDHTADGDAAQRHLPVRLVVGVRCIHGWRIIPCMMSYEDDGILAALSLFPSWHVY